MSNKVMIVLSLILLVCLIGLYANGYEVSAKETKKFDLEYIASDAVFAEYRDLETGVHYFVQRKSYVYAGCGGMCPRYNADGTLYVD